MRRIVFAATILSGFLFVEGSAVAQSQRSPQQPKLPKISKNMPYADARAALIKAGFLPITFPKTEDEQESGGRCGSRGVVCDAYPETKVCTSVEVALCAAYFTGGPEFAVKMVLSGVDLKTLAVDRVQPLRCTVEQIRQDECHQ